MSPANPKRSASEREDTERLVIVQETLISLVVSVQGHNAPADRVAANWMARGQVEGLEFLEKAMVLQVRPVKSIPEGMYQYWTTNPLLQSQLFAAYLCEFEVDIFSVVPEGAAASSFKHGGEILTISVDLETNQSHSMHKSS